MAVPLLLIAALAHADPLTDAGPRRRPEHHTCRSLRGVSSWTFPQTPVAGEPLRMLVLAERDLGEATWTVTRARRRSSPKTVSRGGGPPFWWVVTVAKAKPGHYRFELNAPDGAHLACRSVRVMRSRAEPTTAPGWPITRAWTRTTEDLYAAWIEHLFDAPADARPSWNALHDVWRDPARNLLYNYFGLEEDGPDLQRAIAATPDCADLPYFLRAYFAWKLQLPFGYRHCDRGSSTRATHCGELRTVHEKLAGVAPAEIADAFSQLLRRKVSYVQSGAGRTAPDDDETDLYPVPLQRAALRPGTVYVDPYGHLLVVAKWVPQGSRHSGALYAVDGHPDLSVGRKRFWKGAFLFSADISAGAGGFKAFRPLVQRNGEIVALTNAELRAQHAFPAPSDEQYCLGDDGFYERMEQLINPQPLPPLDAYSERLRALYELVLERVGSVAAGEAYLSKTQYAVVEMPQGPRIFETSGPWEDYSTPARDFRLLLAIDDVLALPQRLMARQKQASKELKEALHQRYESYTRQNTLTYLKSDGKPQQLTLAQVIERRKELEMAYNPNDCIELRWGATGEELATCNRHAPAEQHEQMESYREWFATRHRPPLR